MCFFKRKPTSSCQWDYNSHFNYKEQSFKDALLSGAVQEDDICDYVAYYHAHKDEIQVPLSVFLGMSSNQYIDWIMGAHVSLTDVLKTDL